jgi:Flp pilus assembly protein TadB
LLPDQKEHTAMTTILYLIGVFLLLFWVVGFVFQYILNPLMHLALIAGLIILAVNYFKDSRNRRPV